MTRQSKLIALVAYLLVLTVVMLGYRTNRAAKVKRLRTELASTTLAQNKKRAEEAELARLTRLIPVGSDTPAFMESLYRCAHESGLKQHEVATETSGQKTSARPGAADSGSVTKHRIKVSATGNFRTFAEYLRRVQNIERFNRITEFKLAPDSGQLRGTITVELYSLPVNNGK
ncbi:MAG: type 4a pilus biogenesis protein PilO [Geobacteraceae bacterium]|nr:type 4a pilus biogenesis protein PilO [Geobacteraceae bacterium]